MPSTAPLTRARIAARRNGTRNHVGSSVPRVPIGSATIPADSSSDEPASSSPKMTSRTRGDRAAEGVPADDGGARGVAVLVARPVGGDVDPAEAEAGHDHDERADHLLARCRRGSSLTADQSISSSVRSDVDDGGDAGDPGQHRLHPHDHVVAGDAGRDDQQRDDDGGDDLRRGAARPAELVEDRGRREDGEDREERLPADGDQPRDDAGHLLPVDAERRPAQHHRRAPSRACRRSR